MVCACADILLNPLGYDGSTFEELKKTYRANEAGFLIGATSSLSIVWLAVNYRRNRILQQKKLFVYQEYQKRKFLQRALGLEDITRNPNYFNQKRGEGGVRK